MSASLIATRTLYTTRTAVFLEVIEGCVSNGVDDGLKCCNSSNVSVEQVEGGELEAGQPEEDIVAAAEYPEEGQVGI